MTRIVCPNCGFIGKPPEERQPEEDVILLCSQKFDQETEITTLRFECTACLHYFESSDNPHWSKPVTHVIGRAYPPRKPTK